MVQQKKSGQATAWNHRSKFSNNNPELVSGSEQKSEDAETSSACQFLTQSAL